MTSQVPTKATAGKREFFVLAHSNAAPFFSDDSTAYVQAATPRRALGQFRRDYSHPCGLFAAAVWATADDYHKRKPPLARWLSDKAKKQERN